MYRFPYPDDQNKLQTGSHFRTEIIHMILNQRYRDPEISTSAVPVQVYYGTGARTNRKFAEPTSLNAAGENIECTCMSKIKIDSLYKNKYGNIISTVPGTVLYKQMSRLHQKKQKCRGKPTCKPFPGPGNPALFLTSPRTLISSPGKKWLKLINRTNKY